MQITDLRCDGRNQPIGTGGEVRLSWRLVDLRRGAGQSSARVLVGAGSDPLSDPGSLVWDSGPTSTEEPAMDYAGPKLSSRTQYVWRVEVGDERGEATGWSDPAIFETGVLDTSEWRAGWIGSAADLTLSSRLSLDSVEMLQPLARIWSPGAQVVLARTHLEVPAGRAILAAPLVLAGATRIRAWVNGVEVGRTGPEPSDVPDAEVPGRTLVADVAGLLRPGAHAGPPASNELVVLAEATELPGGLIGRLEVVGERMASMRVVTDGSWMLAPVDGFVASGPAPAPRSHWRPATIVGLQGDPPWGREEWTHRPSPYLRKQFHLDQPVSKARLYSTALGIYEARINGVAVSADRLAPGWTDYNQRIAHQSYDVTDLLAVGDNVLSAVLGDGWYAGTVCWFGPFQYGRQRALLAELHLTLADGSEVCVSSDGSWRCGQGAILYSDLQNGEVFDARAEPVGFDRPGFDDSRWAPAVAVVPASGRVEPQVAPPVRPHEELRPLSVAAVGPERSVVDFGQNLAGHARLRAAGPAGTKVILRHAEALDTAGELYTVNLRSARQVDELVLAGTGEELFTPRFSVHGFRYVEVSGLPAPISVDDITAVALYADMEPVGTWSCSDPLLDQLQSNIVWGQRGNFLSVPTDCPQRDERLGWTGDAQVFVSTAAFNYDVTSFMRKWLGDVCDGQRPGGGVPFVAPHLRNPDDRGLSEEEQSSAGWGDAIVMVPYEIWQATGDLTPARESFEGALAWTRWLERWSTDGLRPASGFGDWLSLGPQTPKDLVSTAFAAHVPRQLAELARALGHEEAEAAALDAQHRRTREAFRRAFVRGGGEVASGTQAAYVLALAFELLDPDEVPAAVGRLVADIEERGWHLSTGFLATPYLLPVLANHGRSDIAWRLLAQRSYPSWLYPVLHGATTMWERWDTWTEHGGFQDPHMNSLNHYAYGAVGSFLYRYVAGLSPLAPGYRRFRVRPIPGGGLTHARAELNSPHGPIRASWQVGPDETTSLQVVAPVGTEAEVWLGAVGEEQVTEAGTPLAALSALRGIEHRHGQLVVTLGSGSYDFTVSSDR